MSKCYHIRFPNIRKMHFGSTSGSCMGIICLHTFTKSNLAVILRSQSSFYDYPFTRYRFCDFFAPPWPFPSYFRLTNHDPKYGTCFFLTLLESYNQFLIRKWIYMEVHMGGNSAPAVILSTRNHFCGIFLNSHKYLEDVYLRRIRITIFFRYIWDVLKRSQKRHLFWDVFETS